MTIVGLHDFVKVSISGLLKSFLLIMCIDAPESTTNSLSSGFNVDAGKHLFSKVEKNVALSCSFKFNTLLASFHAASRAPCSCHSVSSWDRSSKFWSVGAALMRFTWANISERRILVPNFSVTYNGFCEFYTSDWFPCVWALPQNRWRLRRLHVWKDTTQMSCARWSTSSRSSFQLMTGVSCHTLSCQSFFFNMATALLSSFFLDLLPGCSSTWRCAYEHFSPNLQPLLVL